jgi:hypothetical protein
MASKVASNALPAAALEISAPDAIASINSDLFTQLPLVIVVWLNAAVKLFTLNPAANVRANFIPTGQNGCQATFGIIPVFMRPRAYFFSSQAETLTFSAFPRVLSSLVNNPIAQVKVQLMH